MDVSSPGEHRRGRRVALVLGLLVLLLAAVAIASAGDTPLGGGGARRPADQVADVAASLLLVVMAVGTVLLVLLFVLRRDVVAEGARLRRQRGRRTGLFAGAAFFVFLGLSLWVAHDRGQDARRRPPTSVADAIGAAGGKKAREPYEPQFTIWPVLVVAGLAGAGLSAAYLSYRGRRRALGRGDPELALLLADVVEETLDDLRAERDPRKAVIAAYARLERALAAYGLPRRASEAPEEYVTRILRELEVGTASVQRLTTLFARAKFSQHEVDEGMKDEAIETLEELRTELRAAEIRAEEERAAALAQARERAAG
jgi:NADH:ubiquinone oxidoreductase subunit 6 (subunit J)